MYPMWLINAAINGSMNGITVSQRTNMLCDIMNNDRISSALGMLIFTQGASLLFGPYFAGYFKYIFIYIYIYIIYLYLYIFIYIDKSPKKIVII